MAKSQLLKDSVSIDTPLETILFRLKVILDDLDDSVISAWVKSEVEGYEDKEMLPPYRILNGRIMGTYLANGQFMIKNAEIPLLTVLPEEEVNTWRTLHITNEISSLEKSLQANSGGLSKSIPTEFCHLISTPDMQIVEMATIANVTQVNRIVSKVRSKIIDIILELEKKFVNLDDMDIRSQLEFNDIDRQQIIFHLGNIIYEGSIEIGDKNKINKSTIARLFSKGD